MMGPSHLLFHGMQIFSHHLQTNDFQLPKLDKLISYEEEILVGGNSQMIEMIET